eukprot:TRINITY_DN7909_c0_g1_i1.p1 TRINITY_DN7909_c0_g1~~TRINITY_DN7909_c0_g1_i1.p1  ORF type:complete len:108 (+),score=8.80 TRINITY_DN7909_c0_g1_i1:62-385(+)
MMRYPLSRYDKIIPSSFFFFGWVCLDRTGDLQVAISSTLYSAPVKPTVRGCMFHIQLYSNHSPNLRAKEADVDPRLPLSDLMEAITESAADPKPFLPTNFTPSFSHR